MHVITDLGVFEEELIKTHLVHDPSFELAVWYAEQHAMWTGIKLEDTQQWEETASMGDVFIWGILQTLCNSSHINKPPNKWDHWTISWKSKDTYLIMENNWNWGVIIMRTQLLKFNFDLEDWYLQQLYTYQDKQQSEENKEEVIH